MLRARVVKLRVSPCAAVVPVLLSLLAAAWIFPGSAAAERFPCGDLVLPYFEVEVVEEGQPAWFDKVTTVFSVNNCGNEPLTVRFKVWTNWGISLAPLTTDMVLEPRSIFPVNLRDWIAFGRLPDRQLSPAELAHVQAALCGEPSPQNGLYYATPVPVESTDLLTLPPGDASPAVPRRLAVGFVTAQVLPWTGSSEDLWGDFFVVRPEQDYARGESLVRIVGDPSREVCTRHLIRFLEGGGFDAGTRFVFWTGASGFPSAEPEPPFPPVRAQCFVYGEDGQPLGDFELPLWPTQAISAADLAFPEPFGWIDCTTGDFPTFACVDHSAEGRYSVTLRSYCEEVEEPPPPRYGRIHLEKLTQGEDADVPTGPVMPVGMRVDWTYEVTNRGNLPLSEVAVTDDHEAVEVSCPTDALAPGESMTCTASGVVTPGQYRNVGTVSARTPEGRPVLDSDPSHCYGMEPAITLEKATNGVDADEPPGPTLIMGEQVDWTYQVTNLSDVPLRAVTVTDDRGVAVECPGDELAPRQTMTCSAHGIAVLGPYTNLGSVRGEAPDGTEVSASDPSCYTGAEPPRPAVAIEKATNGMDADEPPGPALAAGEAVTWTYVVTNTGGVTLVGLTVSDDQGVAVSCPATTLGAGESMTCTASGTAVAGLYTNLGTVQGTSPDGRWVEASDPSCYTGTEPPRPAVAIEKATNGVDADEPPGPTLPAGSLVTWTYRVTNTGNVPLADLTVSDDQGVAVTCPATTLEPGESMDCTGFGVAVSGETQCCSLYTNLGSAAGTAPDGTVVSASDPSFYTGCCGGGDEGCTPGYWKNHPDSWPPTGYAPEQTVTSVFAQAALFPDLGASSLIAALDFGGGPGLEGAAAILLRAATAALLNAAHPDVGYPRFVGQVIAETDAALASGDRDAMLLLAAVLDADNNLDCPLN